MQAKINPAELQAITLRNIPPDTARRIVEKAATDGISLNKAVLRLLDESAASSHSVKKERTDFSKLAGGWDAEEADAFDKYLAEIRRIDPADWE
jgi:hypothetical protein